MSELGEMDPVLVGDVLSPSAAPVCLQGPVVSRVGLRRSLSYVSLTTATVTGVVALRRRHKWVSLPFCFLEFRVFVSAFFLVFILLAVEAAGFCHWAAV